MAEHIIHVNRAFIAKNKQDGAFRPVFTVKSRGHKAARYARQVDILGPSQLVYPGHALSCGARAWIETDAEIVLHDEMSHSEAKELGLSND